MKQKNGQTKVKSQLNGVQKQNNVKKNKKLVAEEIDAAVIKNAKTPLKQQSKKKALPPKNVELVEEEEESDSGAAEEEIDEENTDSEEEEIEEKTDSEENGIVGEDNESDEEEDEEVKEEVESDEDEPSEEPISKKDNAPAKGRTTKIKTSVPNDFPVEQVVVVKNLPKKFKQIDIVEVFAKYGVIEIINTERSEKGSTVNVAFTTADAAQAALAANNTATIKGSTIHVNIKKPNLKKQKLVERKQQAAEARKQKIELNKDLTVYVKNIKRTTTEEQIREHFAPCGDIQLLIARPLHSYALISFSDAAEIEAAKKLHNSILNGSTIGVFLKDDEHGRHGDVKCTIMLKNKQHLENVSAEKLKTIFSKCGEIDNIDILCRKTVLAFITFKQEKSITKALKLNGTTVDGIEIEISEYKSRDQLRTSVFLQNVKPGTTEEQIRELFATSGPIEGIILRHGFAIVKFQDADGFCKSFLKNESMLQGQIIFLEPYSERKKEILKKQNAGKKRPMHQNKNKGNAKRIKKE